MRLFLAFSEIASIMPCKGDRKKFLKIPAYSGLCSFVRNRGKFPQISVIFALRGVAGSRGRNIAAALAKFPFAALKVLTEASTEKAATFLEQDSTTVPNFAYRLILSCGNLVGVATPSPPFCGLRRLKNPPTKGGSQP